MVMPSMEHHEEISAGIVVLSSTLKALYMNEAAQEILQPIDSYREQACTQWDAAAIGK
jgi:hypothetical protein